LKAAAGNNMATLTSPPPSFSPRRKWSIAFSVAFATIAVFVLLIGVNYVSSKYFFKRFYLSTDTRIQLSPRTISVLKALTNHVDVTIYYDKDETLYADIVNLLNEHGYKPFQLANLALIVAAFGDGVEFV